MFKINGVYSMTEKIRAVYPIHVQENAARESGKFRLNLTFYFI